MGIAARRQSFCERHRVGDVAAELAWHFEQGFDYGRAARYQRLTMEAPRMAMFISR